MTDATMTPLALADKALGELIAKALTAGYEAGYSDVCDQSYTPDRVAEKYLAEFIGECDEIEVIRQALSAPRVPDELCEEEGWKSIGYAPGEHGDAGYYFAEGWNACLEAMLTAAPSPAEPAVEPHATRALRACNSQQAYEIARLRERVKELESLGYSAAARLIAVEDALSDLADYVDERNGDHECRPLENARRALGVPCISPYMAAIDRICEVVNSAPFSAIGHLVEHDPALWAVRFQAARLREGGSNE